MYIFYKNSKSISASSSPSPIIIRSGFLASSISPTKISSSSSDKEKDDVADEIKYHYDNDYYNDLDLCYISKGTTKERDIFEHIGYIRKGYHKEKDDDFDISR